MREEVLDGLRNWNCDVAGALERMVDDTDLYDMCLTMFLEDEGFAALGAGVEKADATVVMDQAHTLKGVRPIWGSIPWR